MGRQAGVDEVPQVSLRELCTPRSLCWFTFLPDPFHYLEDSVIFCLREFNELIGKGEPRNVGPLDVRDGS